MSINIPSLQKKLYNISKERGVLFQILLNQFGAERFMARLSHSPYANNFVFKGGTLLTYLINSDRKTRDLDFSVKQISNHIEDLVSVIDKILHISMDDGLKWKKTGGQVLEHARMPQSGARIKCEFALGKMKGVVWMDVAFGDAVSPVKFKMPVLKYKGGPLIGGDILLSAYPAESIFAEKYQTMISLREANSRMRDLYDVYLLLRSRKLNNAKLKKALINTFRRRKTPLSKSIEWDQETMAKMQVVWERFLKKTDLKGAPDLMIELISKINSRLKKVFSQ